MEHDASPLVPPVSNDYPSLVSQNARMPRAIRPRNIQIRRNFIRAWREYRGLSQDKLVERVREHLPSFSKSNLSRLENSTSPYNQVTLEALALALSVEPQRLLDRDPTSPIGPTIDMLMQMSPADQEQIAKIVATFRRAS